MPSKGMKASRESGFSLIEVMFALALIAISLLALAQLAVVATTQNSVCRTGSVAVTVGQGFVEQLRAKYNARLADPTLNIPELAAGEHPATSVYLPSYSSYVAYEVRWTVTDLSTTEKKVSVEVRPRQTAFATQSVVITSDFAP